jgi:hypothetical protein
VSIRTALSTTLILLGMQSGAAVHGQSTAPSTTPETSDPTIVQRVDPPQFSFYSKVVNCHGLYVRASNAVIDAALLSACSDIETMLGKMVVTQHNLAQRGVQLHLIGAQQSINALPEFSSRRDESLNSPRSVAGIYSACGEENLLPLQTPNDPPINQCKRDLAIAIIQYGFDSKIRSQIAAQFSTAITSGLWRSSPAGRNPQEYWAELSLWYFGGHGTFVRPADHYPAPGRESLRHYDSGGYALLELLYGGKEQPEAIEAIRARDVSTLALSATSHIPAQLQLVNNSGQTLRIFWIDTDGHTIPMGELSPYNRTIKDTFRKHVWMVEDQRGVELERFVVDDAVSEVIAAD